MSRRWRGLRPDGLVAAYLPSAAAVVLLAALAYWRAISAYRAPYRILTDLTIPTWIDSLYAWRWVVRAAMAGAVAALVLAEWRAKSVTAHLRRALSGPVSAALLVAGLALAGRSYLMTPGRMALLDGLNNMASIITVRAALLQGHWPPYYWSNFAWMGFPWLQFHNSLFYYEGALLDLALRDAYLSMKLAVLANHALAAVALYFYVRRLTRSVWAGLVAGVVWATAFFHYHYLVHVGSAHLSLLLPCLPALLWGVEWMAGGGRPIRAVLAVALVTGLALWAHAYYGAIALALAWLYAVARLGLQKRLRWGARLARCGWLAAGAGLGCLSAASQWLPPFLERGLVGQWDRGLRFIQPDVGWGDILSFRRSFLTPDYYGGYVGLSVFGLAVLAVALALLTRDRRLAGLIAWLGVALYLSLGHRYLPYDEIFARLPLGELVYAIRYPGKYLLFAEFSLAALAGASVREAGRGLRLLRRAGARWLGQIGLLTGRLALLASAAVGCEMIFLTLQVNSLFPETWLAIEPGHQEAYDWIRAHGDRTSRVLDKSYSHMEVSVFTGQPSFFSHIEETPPSSALFYWLANDGVGEDLADGELRPATRDGLYLLDVGYLMIAAAPPPDAGWPAGYTGQPFSVWQVAQHSPAIAAPAVRLVSEGEPPGPGDLIEALGLDYERNAAAALPVSALPAGILDATQSAGGPVNLQITGYTVELTRVRLNYRLSAPGYVQLSYSAYPYLALFLDGQRQAYFETALRLVGFASPAGAHTVELRPFLSPARVGAYWGDLAGLLSIALLAWAARQRA